MSERYAVAPTGYDFRQTRQALGLTVERYKLPGNRNVIFAAWEPLTIDEEGRQSHSCTTTMNTLENLPEWRRTTEVPRYGQVGYRRLPDEIAEFEGDWDLRAELMAQFEEAQYAEAYAAIMLAYPQALNGHRSRGEIMVELPPLPKGDDHLNTCPECYDQARCEQRTA